MTPLVIVAAAVFAVIGAVAERVASFWPPDEARRRPPGARTAALALLAATAAGAVAWRSGLSLWATLVYLAFLAPMVFLAATDLEQRRLPHILLDPLIVASLLFVPFNPAVKPLEAAIGAAVALAFLGVTGLIVRGGIAMGDLYLVLPMGLILGWPVFDLSRESDASSSSALSCRPWRASACWSRGVPGCAATSRLVRSSSQDWCWPSSGIRLSSATWRRTRSDAQPGAVWGLAGGLYGVGSAACPSGSVESPLAAFGARTVVAHRSETEGGACRPSGAE